MFTITGQHQLNLQDLEKKFGSMANSSQCCASGTCGRTATQLTGQKRISRFFNDLKDISFKLDYLF